MPADPQYPIGKFVAPTAHTTESRAALIAQIAAAPTAMRAAVTGLTVAQLDTPYRDGGWTIRQVAHHLPDSHLNAYVRVRLALTEKEPTVKTYDEAKWAELLDARTLPVEVSVTLLEALHARWVSLWRALTPEQWVRTYKHPEIGRVTLEWVLAQYAWHGRHHTAQITALRDRNGWK